MASRRDGGGGGRTRITSRSQLFAVDRKDTILRKSRAGPKHRRDSPYPIGPRRSLSTAYWFINSGVDGNFGRATGPHGRQDGARISPKLCPCTEKSVRDHRSSNDRSLCTPWTTEARRRGRTVTPFFPKTGINNTAIPLLRARAAVVATAGAIGKCDAQRRFRLCKFRVSLEFDRITPHAHRASRPNRTLLRFPLKFQTPHGVGV